jgi:hypothetical protein
MTSLIRIGELAKSEASTLKNWLPRTVAVAALAVALAVAPLGAASAHDRFFHRGGPLFLPLALGAAVVAGAFAIATAPVRALAAVPYYAPGYYPPPAPYYAQAPAYYAQPPAYYAPPPGYYPPPPPNYPPPPGYAPAPR